MPDVTVYPDRRLPRAFYALPKSPVVAVDQDGRHSLGLTLYGKTGGLGEFVINGGIFTCTTTLRLTDSEERAVRRSLADRWAGHTRTGDDTPPQPQLLVPSWSQGEVVIRLTAELTLTGRPSFAGGNECTFNERVGTEQAIALAEAWDEDLADASVAYRLELESPASSSASIAVDEEVTSISGQDRTAARTTARHDSVASGPRKIRFTLKGPLISGPADLSSLVQRISLGGP